MHTTEASSTTSTCLHLQIQQGVKFPFNEAHNLQDTSTAACEAHLLEAGCVVIKLSCDVPEDELVEAARSRIDPFVYGKVRE
jgi:hypothetical protein